MGQETRCFISPSRGWCWLAPFSLKRDSFNFTQHQCQTSGARKILPAEVDLCIPNNIIYANMKLHLLLSTHLPSTNQLWKQKSYWTFEYKGECSRSCPHWRPLNGLTLLFLTQQCGKSLPLNNSWSLPLSVITSDRPPLYSRWNVWFEKHVPYHNI